MPSIAKCLDSLSELERKGWNNGAYYSSFEDFHMVLVLRALSAEVSSFMETRPDLYAGDKLPAIADKITSIVPTSSASSAFDRLEEEATGHSKGELSEEAHLFAKFTCTYKIEDFLKNEAGGNNTSTFPQNEVIQAALVFSDLSGFSKLCESYVEKYAGLPHAAQAQAMSQASEKLNVVVNSVFELQIKMVDEYDGDVVNFAGDAMFVLFRADTPQIAAQRAAACSLAMLAETQKR
eukprot:CAMPEP_0113709360 /NCGR_PEP_ID=MMETSP0038_2-20120614/29524_1 /TAXON_ID=2898 /ORGANISM="Cryptomonas paramecium" /LENGTH=235 /DNA_ID=CAMNT_0000635229 /DNA_START=89 /DNA_END=793 /DNA_ORIENTATION=+ /assembly_acc=CAM_ASM_000170